jgi:hypothetical protein
VTDDVPMKKLGAEYGIKMMGTAELLKLMVDHCCISIDKVREIRKYLKYENDWPESLETDFHRFFDRYSIETAEH